MQGARMLRTAFAVAVAFGIAAPGAHAATAFSSPPTLIIGGDTGGPGHDQVEQNKISVFIPIGGSTYRVGESNTTSATMTPSSGCVAVDAKDVDCDPFQIETIGAFLHDGNDSFQDNNVNLPVTVAGGDGNDLIEGGPQNDQLEGDLGDDILGGSDGNDSLTDAGGFGSGGADQLAGQNGNDHLDGGAIADSGAGPDVLDGGPQTDTLTYAQRGQPLTITEDGNANDGQLGEGDNVTNVEKIIGGSAGDKITADNSANTLDGRNGNDNLRGGTANDRLLGGGGNDILNGLIGADVLSGGANTDTATYVPRTMQVVVTIGTGANDGVAGEKDNVLGDVENVYGGLAGDRLIGDDGANLLAGSDGNDQLYGLGGDDTLNGGAFADSLQGSSGDDALIGGPGPDQISGASGDDVITARDGLSAHDASKDNVNCGTGNDHVTVDAIDVVASNCEHVALPGMVRG